MRIFLWKLGTDGNDYLEGVDRSVGIDGADLGNDTILGLGGNDTILGLGGNDHLNGNSGNDILNGGTGNDRLNGGYDYDIAIYRGAYTEYNTRVFSDGSIEIRDTLPNTNGDSGTDTLTGIERINFGFGGAYDVVTGSTGRDILTAGRSWSIIIGYNGNDRLNGGYGNDTLSGGGGNDTLTGGTGADRFIFNSVGDGLDTITDFNSAESDLIQISASGFGGITNTNDFSFNSSNNTLSFKQNQIAILQGVTTFDVATSLALV